MPMQAAENQKRNQQLERDLAIYLYLHGEGVGSEGDWPAEHSFFVAGISRESAIDLGKRYQQNAILFGLKGGRAELIWLGV